jgi:hypothetical protein
MLHRSGGRDVVDETDAEPGHDLIEDTGLDSTVHA